MSFAPTTCEDLPPRRQALRHVLTATSEKLHASWGDHFEYERYRYPFFKEAFHLAYTNYVKSGRPRYSIEVRDERPHPRAAKKNRGWITEGLVKRARERKQKYIIIAGHGRADVRELGYTWFDQAKLEAQFGPVAIFSVPEAEPPAGTALSNTTAVVGADASP